ncbi:MAG: YbhB/YbcL family Raf kinase inhibitor-like protein [Gemmatimonadota bacterium]
MTRIAIAVMGALAVATAMPLDAGAQAQQPPQAQQPRPAQRPRAVRLMSLTSPAFSDGARIPKRHAQAGAELSPALAWSSVPDSIVSFVLLVHDIDAATGNGTDDMLHWLVWNIPGSARGLPEGIKHGAQKPDGSRQISVSGPYYRGPAAPATGPRHHYVFELFALDTLIEVAPTGASPAATRAAVLAQMAGRIRAKGTMIGVYGGSDQASAAVPVREVAPRLSER